MVKGGEWVSELNPKYMLIVLRMLFNFLTKFLCNPLEPRGDIGKTPGPNWWLNSPESLDIK
jgi:hypothetical protein